MDLGKIEKLYSENFDKFGIDSKSVGWNSAGSQQLRFEKLLMVVEDKSKNFSLNELGCGYGELFKYAVAGDYSIDQFNGYDISENMLIAAKEYCKDERAFFFKDSTIKTEADYTVTSGIFNVKFDEQRDNWEHYVKQTLKNMFEQSKKGIAFNLLSKYVDFEAADLFYADPTQYFDYCKKELSSYVNLIHDYNLYEWTIVIKK